jgi:protein TonB
VLHIPASAAQAFHIFIVGSLRRQIFARRIPPGATRKVLTTFLWEERVSSNSENHSKENSSGTPATHSLSVCLVDGDPEQLARAHRLRRRSLLASVVSQVVVLAGLILVPLLLKTEHIAMANIMPMPPYHRVARVEHTPERQHINKSTTGLTFCLSCPPVLPDKREDLHSSSQTGDQTALISDGIEVNECSECASLIGKQNSQPLAPRPPEPTIVHVGHLDPAMLIHRVEPVFPPLALQTRREGTVELHAIIAADGSVISLQFLGGDPMFYSSALDAVRQWRYKPTSLNGHAVEVDTHITVIYKLNR